MQPTQINPIIYGIRGNKFHTFIENLLRFGHLTEDHKRVLLSANSIRIYEQAFTHRSANERCNYEYLEFLGDVTLNKAIPWYLSRRFPRLLQTDGVKVLARLKIYLISSKSFAELADQLYFLDFISSDTFTRTQKADKMLEDVFEAFFGATEMLLDHHTNTPAGVGYSVCYHIISHLLDRKEISLKYEDLYDAKTRLKELFDLFKDRLGVLKYNTVRSEPDPNSNDPRYHECRIYRNPIGDTRGQRGILLGYGKAVMKMDAEQMASEKAIELLNSQGFTKIVPAFYRRLEKS